MASSGVVHDPPAQAGAASSGVGRGADRGGGVGCHHGALVKTYGPGMPPRNPAAEARKSTAALRAQQIRLALRQQLEATAVGVLELARIIGAVLLVLRFHDLTPVPMWLAAVLSFAPNIASGAAFGWVVGRDRYVRWRVSRSVR